MSVVSTAYELQGRTAQKQRTRAALVEAARSLIQRGETPTVEATADAAAISRTTAYRYFPNQRALLAAAHPAIDRRSLLPDDPPADPEVRLALVVDQILDVVLQDEAQQRTMLRLSLDPTPGELPLRQGRAIRWLTEALEPARRRLGDEALRRVVLAARAASGIEALVWLVDVAGLSRQEAREQMRWSALSLYRAAVAEGVRRRR
jgi:AcrR family transcriptional regulator